MQSVKGSAIAVTFTAIAAGTEWSQRSGGITHPVYKPNTLDMTGARFQEGIRD